ncbi:hypothetical protein HAX54_017284, partial [Datura stramonium]|nr:hypothetical protein [Datura stramonium]
SSRFTAFRSVCTCFGLRSYVTTFSGLKIASEHSPLVVSLSEDSYESEFRSH